MNFFIKLKVTCIFAFFLFGSFAYAQTQSPPLWHLDPYNPEYADSTVLIKFKDETAVTALSKAKATQTFQTIRQQYKALKFVQLFPHAKAPVNKLFKDSRGGEHRVRDLRTIYKLTFADGKDAKQVAEEIAKFPDVDYAEPDYYVYMMEGNPGPPLPASTPKLKKTTNTVPNDPLYSEQWYLGAYPGVNAEAAWDSTTGDTTQIIAIIDTGVDWDHPDLDDNIWRNWDEIPDNGVDDDGNGYVDDIRGWDFVNDDNNPNDDNSHGTHVAGIAAAEGNNGVGVCGVAWNAKIMPVKMLQSSGSGSSSDLALAINYAANNGATVINMSLGSYGESQTVKTALENAYSSSVLVAAAGNDGYKVDPPYPPWPPYFPSYPACYSFVIGVEATKQTSDSENGYNTSFTNIDPSGPSVANNNYGHNYEIKAPGVSIYSTFPNGNYYYLNGTSMASPIVAGALSLMKNYNPTQSKEQLFARLIQGANNGILDIRNSLDYALVPDLHYVTYTLVDTLPGDDGDGIADAGETVELYLTVKNAGGHADSVWSKLRLGQFEDPGVANITDSASQIGDISAYATLTGSSNPFRIEIDSDVANNRDIVFEYEIGAKNKSSFKGQLILTVQNGIELSGLYTGVIHLKADKYYIITDNVAFDTLIIDPGVVIRTGNNKSLFYKVLYAIGKPDSMITFTNNGSGYWIISSQALRQDTLEYCIIEYISSKLFNSDLIENSIIRFVKRQTGSSATHSNQTINRCLIISNEYWQSFLGSQATLTNNIIYDNTCYLNNWAGAVNTSIFSNNVLFNNYRFSFGYMSLPWGTKLSPNYWGTIDANLIEKMVEDYFENPSLPVIIGSDSALTSPPNECHGVVWKVLVNGQNPQEVNIDPIGSETVKFDVYINRAMDTTYTPFLTFGVRDPYNQNVVKDSDSWSADSTIWTAYFDVGIETGDGINTIRVANARDDEGFEIPIEDTRFQFTIQAASAASNQFLATGLVGKVDLEWPTAPSDDALGYNMYRIMQLTDSTFTDTTLINSKLITDTTYTDFAVIPDSTYRYAYKVLGTDMAESDYSKFVTGTPGSASSGDANGDGATDVLDIVSIVNYILEENPQPFLFEAADVNSDGSINVLDIVEVVNIILPGAQQQLVHHQTANKARLLVYPAKLILENAKDIAGLQLKLSAGSEKLSEVRAANSLTGFEMGNAEGENSRNLVFYSLSGGIMNGLQEVVNYKSKAPVQVDKVVACSEDGQPVAVEVVDLTKAVLPKEYVLYDNYPNPFNPSTKIKYGVPQTSRVKVTIYNMLGQRVRMYDLGMKAPGYHQLVWDGKNAGEVAVSSGVYFYRIEAGKFVNVKKMLLLR